MKQLFTFFCLLTVITFQSLFAQNTSPIPSDWLGKWSGTLEIYTAKGLTQSVPMQLHILPTGSADRWTQTIYYGEDTIAGKRDYELVVIDAATGHFATDEKNTIVMDCYLLGEKLYNRFEVMGNLLLASTEMVGENLVYEVISGSMEPVSITGDQKFQGQDIPPVKAFPVKVRQVAVLRKQ